MAELHKQLSLEPEVCSDMDDAKTIVPGQQLARRAAPLSKPTPRATIEEDVSHLNLVRDARSTLHSVDRS